MRLVVTKKDRYIFSVLFDENNQPLELSAEPSDTPSRLGNIYVGHVNNIVKNIDAAFIEIEGGCMCYNSLKEKTSYLFGPQDRKSVV